MEQTLPRFITHEVFNQAPPFAGFNLYTCDPALQEAVLRDGAAWAAADLAQLGARLGTADSLALGDLANAHPPQLRAFDASGNRIDEIVFHPAWHALLDQLISAGAHAAPWDRPQAGAQVARAAQYLLFGQVENGSQCPVTMTYAAVPVLRQHPVIAARWLPTILSRRYDPRSLPVEQKTGALIGMGMTEKQGGTDVRANTTRGALVDAAAGAYTIVGHKWFFSVPHADAHLILARTAADGPLSCFFVPRFLPDGRRNAIRVQRLKDKVGNRSNASGEVEFCDATGWLIGAPGRGIPTILEMGSHTRLDCVLGSTAIMRASLCHALHHASARAAFGRLLADQPLMQNVLADLALESEAATAFAVRLARCFDEQGDPGQAMLGRLLTPAGKYWICKRAPGFCFEAMEVMGGNGYVEEGPLARRYREAPVNSIWEGSGNVMCLDLLRAIGKAPGAARAALAAELAPAAARAPALAHYVELLLADLDTACTGEYGARCLAERVVTAVQGALLVQHAPDYISSAFLASRIAAHPGGAYGRLAGATDSAAILARALQT